MDDKGGSLEEWAPKPEKPIEEEAKRENWEPKEYDTMINKNFQPD
jgi:hypothetical protein